MDGIVNTLDSRQMLLSILVAIAVVATVLSLAMPLSQTDNFSKRMKSVSSERETHPRARTRTAGARARSDESCGKTPKAYMKQIVDTFQPDEMARHQDKAKRDSSPWPYTAVPRLEIVLLVLPAHRANRSVSRGDYSKF